MKRTPDVLWQAFEDGHQFTLDDGRVVTMRSADAGPLMLPSGRIVVSDPILDPSNRPFSTSVEPGSYSIHLALDDDEVALVMVMFKEGQPITWKRSKPRDFSVDSGTGCIMDHQVARFLRRKAKADKYERFIKVFEDALAETGWGSASPIPTLWANVFVFRTLGGDGTFPIFFGYDAEGDVICLVIDMFTDLLDKDHE
jgi:hypothetical protein